MAIVLEELPHRQHGTVKVRLTFNGISRFLDFHFNTSDGCDCDCGDVDPDCSKHDDVNQLGFGCMNANFICIEGVCHSTIPTQSPTFLPTLLPTKTPVIQSDANDSKDDAAMFASLLAVVIVSVFILVLHAS